MLQHRIEQWALGAFVSAIGVVAQAGDVQVVGVDIKHQRDDLYRVAVTLRHGDAGWEHYADAWEVLGPEGEVLGRRVLAHPHVDEQPFTRSLSGVRIPAGIKQVQVRGRDKVHGLGPAVTVPLPPR